MFNNNFGALIPHAPFVPMFGFFRDLDAINYSIYRGGGRCELEDRELFPPRST